MREYDSESNTHVVYALSKAARENIITALYNEICEKQVSEDKDIFGKVAGDVVLGQFIKQTDSPNITKSFANCTTESRRP